MPEPQNIAALREAAEAARIIFEPGWPRRDIDTEATCDGCAEFKRLVAAYDHPTGVSEPWLCADCAAQADFEAAFTPDVVLALLSEVERGRALRAAVEALVGKWRKSSHAIRDATGDYEDGVEYLACADNLEDTLAAHVPSPLPVGGAAGAGEVGE